ncbi:hypothetical protein BMS3Abin02_02375 [bacterium BMS3Abin02]|nr:hypothetical protein BMS3Abin02_02375 [bacterium BMS3Abin02]GBE21462.1 hypothetical protein BMS3Bbin01_00807 [bacterium BMS3Bbin01]HDH26905.1 DUF4332 domain-containing protein [Actinomycetota bacterium]HDK44792.1 DUF4332 domain-containing protein [Actinomycetota bacterium]HDL49332.1 DUF4332 domain-containing protein [Actinomycetota bacterium]
MASIDELSGISVVSARSLRRSRVRTTEALLKRGRTRRGRRQLAEETGLMERQILQWVNRADLMRIRGIGGEYADLLEASGVDTVKELRRRNAASLTNKMMQVNDERKLVRRLPTEGMVARWISLAAETEPVIKR